MAPNKVHALILSTIYFTISNLAKSWSSTNHFRYPFFICPFLPKFLYLLDTADGVSVTMWDHISNND